MCTRRNGRLLVEQHRGQPPVHLDLLANQAEMRYFETITDVEASYGQLRRRRFGVIETADGRLQAIHLRPWPKVLSLPELWPVGARYHGGGEIDRCRLYYNQPRNHASFLALKYIVTTPGTSFATFRAALRVLDAIAQIKHSDAIVCDAANRRLSDRVMARLGWQPHKPQRWHRNFIRRFYGHYPAISWPL